MRPTRIAAVICLALLASCGRKEQSEASFAKADVSAPASGIAPQRAEAMPRKVVHNVDLGLSVPDADAFIRAVEGIAARTEGFIADKQVSRDGNRVVGGTLVLRVPTEKLQGTSESLRALGTLTSESVRAEDISEEYYDLASRLKNARNLEARLLRLIEEKTTSLADVIQVEAKLSEVREQIERLEGKQRLWDNQVALATLRLSFSVPLPMAEKEGFFSGLASTFNDSVKRVGLFFRGLAFVVAALLPWSPLGLMGYLLIRALNRRTGRKTPSAAPPTA